MTRRLAVVLVATSLLSMLVAIVASAFVVVKSKAPAEPLDVVQARQFEVVDAAGEVCVVLRGRDIILADEEHSIVLNPKEGLWMSSGGSPQVAIRTGDRPHIVLWDSKGLVVWKSPAQRAVAPSLSDIAGDLPSD